MDRAIGAGFGLAADQLLGEPPVAVHPVVGFGRAMSALERGMYRDTRLAGVAFAGVGIAGSALAGAVASRLLGRRSATALAAAICIAGRMLGREAAAVGALLDRGELDAARLRLASLVGRDTATLDESEIARAVVESVAENTVDAVTASLLWAAAGGAPGVLAHRAVNTLDAMVGHRNERYSNFGWASARLDDAANFVPARLSALAVAAVTPRRAAAVWRAVRDDAPQHPSPNGGVIEAAFASALGVRLGGENRYGDRVEQRGVLGTGRAPASSDIGAAVALASRISWVVALATVGAAAVVRRRS